MDKRKGQSYPTKIGNQYSKEMHRRVTKTWYEAIDDTLLEKLPSVITNKSLDVLALNKATVKLQSNLTDTLPQVSRLSKKYGQETSIYNKGKLEKIILKPYTRDIPNIKVVMETFVDYNVRLVKGLSEDTIQKLTKRIVSGLDKGYTVEQIQKSVRYGLVKDSSVYKTIKSRMNLITTDQVSKLNSNLTELRHKFLGITNYVWHSEGGLNAREEHSSRDNKVFNWNNPPGDGHPGEAINCRCWAEPVLSTQEA